MTFVWFKNGVGSLIEIHEIVFGEKPDIDDLREYDVLQRNLNQNGRHR